MKFFSIFFFTLVSANAVLPPVDNTEDPKLVESVDLAIKEYLENNNSTMHDEPAHNGNRKGEFGNLATKITNEMEARGFVKYAGAAYCNERRLLNWSCGNCDGHAAGSSDTVYFSAPETNAAGYLTINKNKKLIVLGYRGTHRISDWLYNLDIGFTSAGLGWPYHNAGLHSGFNTMANSLYRSSSSALKKALAKYPNYKVVFTGHSLGGAVAALNAFKLAQSGTIKWEKINLITYGQPRLGNQEFADFLNSKPWTSTRVTSFGDLVAISPGRFLDYSHNQYNMHINKNGQTVHCSIYGEDKNCISDHLIPSARAHFTYWDQRMNTRC